MRTKAFVRIEGRDKERTIYEKMVLTMCATKVRQFKSGCAVMAKIMPIINGLGKKT